MTKRLIQGTAIGLMTATSMLAVAAPSVGELSYSPGVGQIGAPPRGREAPQGKRSSSP